MQSIGAYPAPDILLEQTGDILIDKRLDNGLRRNAVGHALARTYTVRNARLSTPRISNITLDGANPYDPGVDTGATSLVVTSGNTTASDMIFAPAIRRAEGTTFFGSLPPAACGVTW